MTAATVLGVLLVLVVVLAGALLRRVVLLGWELALSQRATRGADERAAQRVETIDALEADLMELRARSALLTRRVRQVSGSALLKQQTLELLVDGGHVSPDLLDAATTAAGYTVHRPGGVSRRAIRALEGGPLVDSAVMVGGDDDERNGNRRPCTASQALDPGEVPGPLLGIDEPHDPESLKRTTFLGADRATNLSLHELAALLS